MRARSHTGYQVSRSTLAQLFPWATHPRLGWKRLWWEKVVVVQDGWREGDPWTELPAVVCHFHHPDTTSSAGGGVYTLHTLDTVVTL